MSDFYLRNEELSPGAAGRCESPEGEIRDANYPYGSGTLDQQDCGGESLLYIDSCCNLPFIRLDVTVVWLADGHLCSNSCHFLC